MADSVTALLGLGDGIGCALSLVLFILDQVRGKKAALQAVREVDADHTIRDYLEWVRRQDQASLVQLIRASQEHLLRELGSLGTDVHGLSARLLREIGETREELVDRLKDLNTRFPPPVLSPVPLRRRPLTALPLLARDSELGWLEGDTSDAVVYGQPGSGKTYLLYHFAQRVDGRFLLTRSSDAAVGAVISGCPPVLIVDDAAAEIDLIHRLNHLRRTNGLVFRLIAVCWPFECEDLLSAMELPESRALEVPLLPRAIIAELVQSLIKQAGYEAPNAIVREINNQAVGRPGLAVALTVAALQEDLPAVMRGETLAQTMGRVFESIVGGRAAHIMSAFSVGGKAGMEMEDVAHAIEMPILALHRALRDMAPGGVFEPLSKTRLTATPRAMRRALLKEVFFRPEGVCLPLPIYETLLRAAPDHDEAVITLLESALVGADVDPTWLRTLVADSSAGKVWETYAWLGARQCRDVIENHPHMAQHIVEPALQWVPSLMIPRMLDSAAGDDGPFHGSPDAPLRKLAEWVSHGEAGTPSAVQRRRDLFAATRSWLDAGGEPRTAFLALEPCFRLAYESTDTDPGDGMKVTFSSGLLPLADAEQIAALWPGVLEIARQHGIPNWKPVTAIVSHWLHPRSQFGKSGGDEYTDRTVPVARRMIEEIMPLCGGHNGFLRWVYAHAAEVGLDPSMVPVDREYLALYPVRRPSGDWRAAAEKDSRDAEAVVDSWKDRPLSDVIARLQRYEREAASMEDSWPRLSPHVCRLLAERRGLRDTDILALIAAGVPADLVDAFVVAAIAKGVPVEDVLRECVSQEGYRHLAIYHTLTGSAPHLYPLIRDHLPEHMQQVGRLAYRGNIPVEIMTLLLDHEDRRVRLSAALVEVSSQPGGQVRATVRNAWRKAVVEGLADSERTGDLRHIYDLDKIIACDRTLAFEILKAMTAQGEYSMCMWDLDPLMPLLNALHSDERLALLDACAQLRMTELPRILVGDDTVLYRRFLGRPEMRRHHLTPLIGSPTAPGWIDKALVALEFGYTPMDVALAARGCHWGGWGPMSRMWQRWINEFAPLLGHSDSRVQAIGKAGTEWSTAARDEAVRREKYEAVHGHIDE